MCCVSKKVSTSMRNEGYLPSRIWSQLIALDAMVLPDPVENQVKDLRVDGPFKSKSPRACDRNEQWISTHLFS